MRRLLLGLTAVSGLAALACDDAATPSKDCIFGICERGFSVVYQGDVGAVLSVFAPDGDHTLAVGGPLGNAAKDLVVAQGLDPDDDSTWDVQPSLGANSHWWIWGPGDASAPLYLVGEHGEVLRWTPGAPSAETVAAGLTAATLYGVWGSAANDVWVVGGDPLQGGEKDVVLHFDGAAWTRLTVPEPKNLAYFKVWGHAADDVWIACQGGWILRVRGTVANPTFKWYPVLPGRSVFTINGNAAGDVWAVSTPGGIFHYNATTDAFDSLEPPFEAGGLNGVSVAPGGDVWIVGAGGTKWRRSAADEKWSDFTLQPPRGVDLHAVLANDDGAVFVGGAYVDPPRDGQPRAGVVAVGRP